jgi:hypothetical protein
LLEGAVNATLAVVIPVAEAVPIVGAFGTEFGETLLLAELFELLPAALVANTVNV